MTFDLKKRTVCEIDVDIINQYGICVYVLYTSKQIPARLDYVLSSVFTRLHVVCNGSAEPVN